MKNDNIKIDSIKFQNMEKAFKANVLNNALPILEKTSLRIAETLSRLTPNPRKSRSIPTKNYNRPVYDLLEILRKKRKNQSMDKTQAWIAKHENLIIEHLKKRQRFLIIRDVKRKMGRKYWFFTNARVANSKSGYRRIMYRGLMKAMYGLELLKRGLTSTMFNKLFSNSPKLKEISNLNEIIQSKTVNSVAVKNINKTLSSSLVKANFAVENKMAKKILNKEINNYLKTYFNKIKGSK